jgi:hypothetical protein
MVVESVFNISGAGSIFVNSIQNRDVFPLGGAVIVYCVAACIVFNLSGGRALRRAGQAHPTCMADAPHPPQLSPSPDGWAIRAAEPACR